MRNITMNKVRKISTIFAAVLLTVVMMSCNNIFNAKANGKIEVTFDVGEKINSGRTAFPNPSVNDLENFELFMIEGEEETALFEEPAETLADFCHTKLLLEPGEYTFLLKAKIKTTKFEGKQSVVISEETDKVTFTLARKDLGDSNDTGFFEYSVYLPMEFHISYPDVNGSFSIYTAEDDLLVSSCRNANLFDEHYSDMYSEEFEGTEYSINDFSWKFKFTEEELPSGNYYYVFNIYNYEKTQYYEETEYFSIAAGIKTVKQSYNEKTIDLIPVSFELNEGIFENGYDFYCCKKGAKINLDELIPVKEDYVFNGWYLDEGFSESVSGIVNVDDTIDSKTFYAKWKKECYFEKFFNIEDDSGDEYTFTVEPEYMYELIFCDYYSNTDELETTDIEFDKNNIIDAIFDVYLDDFMLADNIDDNSIVLICPTVSSIKIKSYAYSSGNIGQSYVVAKKKPLPQNMGITENADGTFTLLFKVAENSNSYKVQFNDKVLLNTTSVSNEEIAAGFCEVNFRNKLLRDSYYSIILSKNEGYYLTDYYFAGKTEFDGIPDLAIVENENGTFSYRVNYLEDNTKKLRWEFVFDSKTVNGDVEITADDLAAGYKEFCIVSPVPKDCNYTAKLSSYIYSTSSYTYPEITGTAQYDGGYIKENADGTLRIRYNVDENIKNISCSYDIDNTTESVSALTEEIEVTDTDRANGFVEFTVNSVFNKDDNYTVSLWMNTFDNKSTRKEFTGIAQNRGNYAISSTATSDGVFEFDIGVEKEISDIRIYLTNEMNSDTREITEYIPSNERMSGIKHLTMSSPLEKDDNYIIEVYCYDPRGSRKNYKRFKDKAAVDGKSLFYAKENEDGSVTIRTEVGEGSSYIKVHYSYWSPYEDVGPEYIIDLTPEDLAAGYKIFNVNSPIEKDRAYYVFSRCIDSKGKTVNSGESEKQAAYNGNSIVNMVENSNGTFSGRLEIVGDIRSVEFNFNYSDSFNYSMDVTDEDRAAGYKDFTVLSPYHAGGQYEIRILVRDSNNNYYRYIPTGIAEYEGAGLFSYTENSDGTFTVVGGIIPELSYIEVKYTVNYYTKYPTYKYIVEDSDKDAWKKEIVLPSIMQLGDYYVIKVNYCYENGSVKRTKYSTEISGNAAYKGNRAGAITQNADGTITIGLLIMEQFDHIDVEYRINSSDYGEIDSVEITEEDVANGYKEFTVASPFNTGDEYTFWVDAYGETNNKLYEEILTGTAE